MPKSDESARRSQCHLLARAGRGPADPERSLHDTLPNRIGREICIGRHVHLV